MGYHIICIIIISALSVAHIILLSLNIAVFQSIDFDGIFKYAKDARCSEGPLQVALERAYDAIIYERMLHRLALSFLVVGYTS